MKKIKHNGKSYYLPELGEELTLGRYIRLSYNRDPDPVAIIAALLDIEKSECEGLPAKVADIALETTATWLHQFMEGMATGEHKSLNFMGIKIKPMLQQTVAQRMFWLELHKPDTPAHVMLVDSLACAVGHQLYGDMWLDNIESLRNEVKNQPAQEALGAFFTFAKVQSNMKHYIQVWWYGLKASMKASLLPRK